MIRNQKGFSLLELLGAVAVVAALATVSVVSIKDAVQAGQRAGAQKDLQNLNSALQNFRSSGGVMPPGANARGAIDMLKGGVDLSGSNFTPLSSDPDMSREIAGETYDLNYSEEDGFTYEPANGSGLMLAGAGLESAVPGTFPFDVNDPVAASNALEELATLDPGSDEYNSLLAGLNAANMLGTISDEAMAGAGLIKQGDQWKDSVEAFEAYAQEAQSLLAAGSTWNDLSTMQQIGYANTYSSEAVSLAGADALNLMSPGILTPELVTGYVLNTSTWVEPQVQGPVVNATTFTSSGQDWSGWTQPFPVVRVTDPLLPAEVVGWVTPYSTWYTTTSSSWGPDADGNWGMSDPVTSEPRVYVYYTFRPNLSAGGISDGGVRALSTDPMIGGGGGSMEVTILSKDTPPTSEYIWSDFSFTSSTGGSISVLAPTPGMVVPDPTPTPTPSGGLFPGGGGGFSFF